MNINRKAIKLWMKEHALEHEDGPALAKAAMKFFLCEETWIWDAAQIVHDIMTFREMSKRYG